MNNSGRLAYDNKKDNSDSKSHEDAGSSSTRWLTVLLFLISSSLLFLGLFEWDRYRIIAGPRMLAMSFSDKVLLSWLLLAKSLVWFLPLLLIWPALILLELRRTAAFMVNFSWILLFYFMAIDAISVGFAGYHCWEYLPNIRDMFQHPELKIWQWGGEKLTTEAVLLFTVFVVSGPALFLGVRWVTERLVRRLSWLRSRKALAALTFALVFIVVGISPALQFFSDRNALDRIYSSLPLPAGLKESFEGLTEQFDVWLGTNDTAAIRASLSAIGDPGAERLVRRLRLFVDHRREAGLLNSMTRDVAGISAGVPGISDRSKPRTLPIQGDMGRAKDHWARTDQPEEPAPITLLNEAVDPSPADSHAAVRKSKLPNVILIIFESFRHSALGPERMKELDAWTKQGLRLQRHYSGSNCSHLGLFSLFYGRSALGYKQTLDRRIPAQMLESLRQSGYRITFLTAGEVKGFRRLGEWINDESCDVVIEDGDFSLAGMKDWPGSDRRKLERVRTIVNDNQDQPQFVFFYLVSSHYRYAFPPEFDIFKESATFWQFVNPRQQMQNHLNRYSNSLLFLQHELMNLFRSIDLKRNIVMITGDHGESMGEDGVFTHGSRMSEIQMRVPFAMVGPGIEPRTVSTATVHTDVLPTLMHALAGETLPVRNCQGRDLIAEASPVDEVAVVPANGPEWEGLMVVRGNKRMVFRTKMAEKVPSIEFAGLVDESGQYDLKVERTPQAAGPRDVNVQRQK